MAAKPAIHLRIHPDLRKRLDDEAQEQHLDKTAIVTVALNQYFAKLDEDKRLRRA